MLQKFVKKYLPASPVQYNSKQKKKNLTAQSNTDEITCPSEKNSYKFISIYVCASTETLCKKRHLYHFSQPSIWIIDFQDIQRDMSIELWIAEFRLSHLHAHNNRLLFRINIL